MKQDSCQEKIAGRLFIYADLRLLSPLLIGQGETYEEGGVDIKVLKDKEGSPYIPGTSLAGILREKLAQYNNGKLMDYLFGSDEVDDSETAGCQSSINILDVPLQKAEIQVRDGIRIDTITGVVAEHAKYDFEVVERGAGGKLTIEMILRNVHINAETGQIRDDIAQGLSMVAGVLQNGFEAGAKTTVGLGKIGCENIKLYYYDFHKKEAVKAWLTGAKQNPAKSEFLYQLPETKWEQDQEKMIVDVDLSLRSSLLVRNYVFKGQDKADKISAIPMESKGEYLIPGTSVKGVLRNHAAYILRRLGIAEEEAINMLDGLMGYMPKEGAGAEEKNTKIKSRFLVKEVIFSKKSQGISAFAQRRNRIDRFTNGTVDAALFATKPLWKNGNGAPVHVHFEIEQCNKNGNWEAGLALFLLKDLCTGNIAIGGEKSIGRGTLQGEKAIIQFANKTWELDGKGTAVQGDAAELERMAANLIEKRQVKDL